MAVEARTTPRPFAAPDLDDMPDDGYRREIIDGSLVVTPAHAGRHQWCLFQLSMIMAAACPPDLMVLFAPYDWRPPTGESFQPDLMAFPRRYEALGVPAYWIIDPSKPSFTALRLQDGRYKRSAQAEAYQRIQLDYPFPVEIVPAELTTV